MNFIHKMSFIAYSADKFAKVISEWVLHESDNEIVCKGFFWV